LDRKFVVREELRRVMERAPGLRVAAVVVRAAEAAEAVEAVASDEDPAEEEGSGAAHRPPVDATT